MLLRPDLGLQAPSEKDTRRPGLDRHQGGGVQRGLLEGRDPSPPGTVGATEDRASQAEVAQCVPLGGKFYSWCEGPVRAVAVARTLPAALAWACRVMQKAAFQPAAAAFPGPSSRQTACAALSGGDIWENSWGHSMALSAAPLFWELDGLVLCSMNGLSDCRSP